MLMLPHTLPQAGLAGRLIGGCASVPPQSHYRWAHRSPTSRPRTPCPTGSDRSPRTHGHTPRLPSLTASRWARRSPHALGCTPAATLLLVGGPAGRLLRMPVPQARTLHQPCRPPVGPQAASCPWLHRNAATLSRRRLRRPPHARGCTALPPLFLVGGPAGRLMHVAVPHATTLSRR